MSFRQPIRDMIARRAAKFARERLGIEESNKPNIAFILGSGLCDQIPLDGEVQLPLKHIPDFRRGLYEHPTHPRVLCFGTRNGTPLLVQRGRVHIHEMSPDPNTPSNPQHLVRLQTDLLIELGAKTVVIVSSVGSLDDKLHKPGDVVVINDFTTLYAAMWPLFSGEHPQPTSALDMKLDDDAFGIVHGTERMSTLPLISAWRYILVRMVHIHGPVVETVSDKTFLRTAHNAGVVGMSIAMDASVVALHRDEGVRALCLGVVSNNVTDTHDGAAVERCVEANAAYVGAVLDKILARLTSKT